MRQRRPMAIVLGIAMGLVPAIVCAAGSAMSDDQQVIKLADEAADRSRGLTRQLVAIDSIGLIGCKSKFSKPLLSQLLDPPSVAPSKRINYLEGVVDALNKIDSTKATAIQALQKAKADNASDAGLVADIQKVLDELPKATPPCPAAATSPPAAPCDPACALCAVNTALSNLDAALKATTKPDDAIQALVAKMTDAVPANFLVHLIATRSAKGLVEATTNKPSADSLKSYHQALATMVADAKRDTYERVYAVMSLGDLAKVSGADVSGIKQFLSETQNDGDDYVKCAATIALKKVPASTP